jgi:hypothetical protein
MTLPGRKYRFAAGSIGILLLVVAVAACSARPTASPGNPAHAPSLTATSRQSGNPTQAGTPSADQTATSEATIPSSALPATNTPPESDWREAPIIPEVSAHVLAIYRDGQAQGRNPQAFSVIGDCQGIPYVFMGPYGRGELVPDSAESYLWDAIKYFKASFLRWGMTVRGGFTAASLLSPIQADPHYCLAGETPLTCEYRLNNPAFVIITLETWLDPNTIDRYEIYLRQILDYVIAHGSVPILMTKADASELASGTHVINPAIVRVARDYDVPVVNFWRAAQYLDNYGLDPAREGFHLSQEGYNLKNLLALRTLYKVWRAAEFGENAASVTPNDGQGTPTAAPSPQASPASPPEVVVTIPNCEGGCIFFATVRSLDGVITPQGVYAYSYSRRVLTPVLGVGFDLQDASADGRRLLVNSSDRLYEIDLQTGSSRLISDSFFSFGNQDAYWSRDGSTVVFLDLKYPLQTADGAAIQFFPSWRDGEQYFETGTCVSKENCTVSGVYRQNPDQSLVRLDSFSRLVFSPDGQRVAFLNPAAATQENYYHISYLMMEDPGLGIGSRRIFYFPPENGFMVYPDVREYAFSSDNRKLAILYDVYSAYFEKSLRTQTYLIDFDTNIRYDFGSRPGTSASLHPRLVWAPQSDRILFFLTDVTAEGKFSLSIFQTDLLSGEKLALYDQGILTDNNYFYITNIYWR